MRRYVSLTLFTLLLNGVTLAQTTAAIVSADASAQPIARVAPGQILRLRFSGITTPFSATPVATSVPLPTNMQGLSVSLRMSGIPGALSLPMIRGGGIGSCFSVVPVFRQPNQAVPCSPEETSSEFQVQVPFELQPNLPGDDRCSSGPSPTLPVPPCQPAAFKDAVLTIVERAGTGKSLRVLSVVDQIHVLTSCEYSATNDESREGIYGKVAVCEPVMTHPNGTTVNAERPALAGEMVAAYAYGLGAPDGRVETGAATPAGGLRVSRAIKLSFPGVAVPDSAADYAGLVEGFVGLYQINFRVPALPGGLPPCSETRASNLSVILKGASSRDQIGFCVRAE